jgi:hypothetical protein
MRRDKFSELVTRFAERPMPALQGRHVYLWEGEVSSLQALMPPSIRTPLDLHRLAAALPSAPRAEDEARRRLRAAILDHLHRDRAEEGQHILVVTGCDLLSRYRVPLAPFLEVVSERLMVVFAVAPRETHFAPITPLPSYVHMTPAAARDYLRAQLAGTGSVVAEES